MNKEFAFLLHVAGKKRLSISFFSSSLYVNDDIEWCRHFPPLFSVCVYTLPSLSNTVGPSLSSLFAFHVKDRRTKVMFSLSDTHSLSKYSRCIFDSWRTCVGLSFVDAGSVTRSCRVSKANKSPKITKCPDFFFFHSPFFNVCLSLVKWRYITRERREAHYNNFSKKQEIEFWLRLAQTTRIRAGGWQGDSR